MVSERPPSKVSPRLVSGTGFGDGAHPLPEKGGLLTKTACANSMVYAKPLPSCQESGILVRAGQGLSMCGQPSIKTLGSESEALPWGVTLHTCCPASCWETEVHLWDSAGHWFPWASPSVPFPL